MNDAFSRGLGEIADDAARTSTDLHVDLIVSRRRRRRATRRAVATGGAVVVVGVALLAGSPLLDHRSAPLPPAGPTSAPPSPAASPTTSTPVPPSVPAPQDTPPTSDTEPDDTGAASGEAVRPLVDPSVNRFILTMEEKYDPDEPAADGELLDGDYFGVVKGVDLDALTLDIDVYRIYTPRETVEYWVARGDPREEVEADFPWIHRENVSKRVRTVPVSPDVAITGACANTAHTERISLEELAGPRTTTTCDTTAGGPNDITREFDAEFWVDIRGGRVVQMVGQFVS